jgi:uronate dehydrogenase
MPDPTQKPVLLTGASGRLGVRLAEALSTAGWTLRMTDIVPFPGQLPASASFAVADLTDGLAIERLAEGCGTILHFGGVSTERPYHEIRGPNLDGMFNILEAARREHARLVFASSNHTVGFYERGATLMLRALSDPTVSTASPRLSVS